jgi:5-methyltetrahydrofolate--homocysteine methyltransferase
MAEGAGFQVIDLGVDVQPQKFVNAVKEHQAQLVGMSALLTTTMTRMSDVIRALEESGIRDNVKVIIGGAATTQDWAAEIGADAYAADAATAAEKCKELIAQLNPAA